MAACLGGNWNNVMKIKKIHEILISILKHEKYLVKVFSIINNFRYSEQTSRQVQSQSPGLLQIRPQSCT